MVLVNLIPKSVKKKERISPLSLSLMGMGLALLFVPHFGNSTYYASIRKLDVEETEIFISVLQNVGEKSPQFNSATQDVQTRLTKKLLPLFVDSSKSATWLIRPLQGNWVVSSRFFEADSMLQERSMVQAVSVIHPEIRTNDVAVLPTE